MDNNQSDSPVISATIPVKKENEEEIKEYAETAMNELLGWYGYERLELRRWAASRDKRSPDAQDLSTKDECTWCNKSISNDSGAIQQSGAAFCSELCFSQSRRANFKRAKTCDWCRHVRHTVAYVDFQDGASQLQFCSDKCLNQYKMHIFCRETQAHLDLNPHLANASSTSSLITPELWLKNCKSRSNSPNSEKSTSPNSEALKTNHDKTDAGIIGKSSMPLITVAPTSKLMKQKTPEESTALQKSPEVKNIKIKHNTRKRRLSKCSSTITSQSIRQHTNTPKAQDLRMCSPSIDGSSPASTNGTSAMNSPPQNINPLPIPPMQFPNPMFGVPPFMDNRFNEQRFPNMFPPRMNFPPRHAMPMPERPRFPIPPMAFPPQFGTVPPVTMLVPYPVMVPIPIPIPIPLPLTAFLQAQQPEKVKTEVVNTEETEGPLDFTMNSEKNKSPDTKDDLNDKNNIEEDNTKEMIPEEQSAVNENVEKESTESSNAEQTLPKFKITRFGSKMAKIVPKTKDTLESSRPLRKRRRLVEAAADEEMLTKTRKIVQV